MVKLVTLLATALVLSVVLAEKNIPVEPRVSFEMIEPRIVPRNGCPKFLRTNFLNPGETLVWSYSNTRGPKQCGFYFETAERASLHITCPIFNLFRAQLMKIVSSNGSKLYNRFTGSPNQNLGQFGIVILRRLTYQTGFGIRCEITAVTSNSTTTAASPTTTAAPTTTTTITAAPTTTTITAAPTTTTITAAPTATTTTAAPTTTTTTTVPTTTTTTAAPTTTTITAAPTTTTTIAAPTTTTTVAITPEPRTCRCGNIQAAKRIIGGTDANLNEYTYQVGLVQLGQVFCGASLISDRWILTVAHCTIDTKVSSFQVLLGGLTTNPVQEGRLVRAIRIINHESYNSRTLDNDISLIEIDPIDLEAEYPNISPICLPTSTNNDFAGINAVVTGWGATSYRGEGSNILQGVTIPTISNSRCSQDYGNSITSNMMCTFQSGKDSCQGDSGGPLAQVEGGNQATQIGIVSWGYQCDVLPRVYTRVSNYLGWIDSRSGGLNTCPK